MIRTPEEKEELNGQKIKRSVKQINKQLNKQKR